MKSLLTSIFPLLFLITFMSNCRKEALPPCACGVENPHENLTWLKEILDKSYCVEVYLLIYKGEEIIGIYDCPRGTDYGATWFKCDGTMFCYYQGFTGHYTCPEDFEEADKNKSLIYSIDKPLPKPKK